MTIYAQICSDASVQAEASLQVAEDISMSMTKNQKNVLFVSFGEGRGKAVQ